MTNQFTLYDLEQRVSGTPGRITLRMLFATTHAERIACVELALEWIAQHFTKTRQERQNRSEDALSSDLVCALKAMNFQANHDTAYGGHCDIVIEGADNFLWLGEAKKHQDYAWLLKGFQQLDTRYATGLAGQDHGGMIVYTYNADSKALMDSWRKFLCADRADISVEDCPGNPLAFRTKHRHEGSGLTFNVLHLPVSLYFNPRDKG